MPTRAMLRAPESPRPVSTPYHSQYWAYALTLKGATDTVDNLSRAISNARVDLNPHQVDAALFAVRSPLSRGVILADEVGLGKTIEAALVISQRWAERRRRILVVVPASLRKQWQQELADKFFLPSIVMEAGAWGRALAEGARNPFDQSDRLVLCSYAFAANRADELAAVAWDLVVIDEAHRLRNVYKPGNKMAKALMRGVGERPKLLLTATPLQNSLMELYGLVSIIDPHVFGDPISFREQFVRAPDEGARNRALQARLATVCQRTLRRQVLEYVRFTQRIPLTQEFAPSDAEHALYEQVSEYLRREHLFALPKGQRTLMTMVLRKLLASSSFAIAGTLRVLLDRLRGIQAEALAEALGRDFEGLEAEAEEWEDPTDQRGEDGDEGGGGEAAGGRIDVEALADEIGALGEYLRLAEGIAENAKGEALVRALAVALDRAEGVGAARKAVVFTESRRTQAYLHGLLTTNGYAGRVVMLNGSNADPESRALYESWLGRHAEGGAASGSRAVDTKAAIVEAFRDDATILLATEAAAEGVNLQFCSLVVNYDLPWNPQRVEQRIGRCHRYGQKHDVVVVNFLNQRNAADQRVFELLSEKFHLFEGVFGASDEVLGALESGTDIERRIVEVYQTCRTPAEITAAFDRLQAELDEQIRAQLSSTRQAVLDHFDEDVHARLRVHRDEAVASLGQRERWLLGLTRAELGADARFDLGLPRFWYLGDRAGARTGWYNLDWREAEARGDTFYRVDHPLAAALVEEARTRVLPTQHVAFDYSAHGGQIAVLAPLVGRSGWMTLGLLTVESLDTEEILLLAGTTDHGAALDAEVCARLFGLRAAVGEPATDVPDLAGPLAAESARGLRQVEVRNGRHFDAEVAKLDGWSDDLKLGLERELKDIDSEIRDARRRAVVAISLADKLDAQRSIRTLEQKRNRKRRDLFEAQDRIDEQRAALIAEIERQLATTHTLRPLFTVRWALH
ncbi:MAG: SNF2-related protein [Myxococcota bacterium]